jgi:hypothetical protein
VGLRLFVRLFVRKQAKVKKFRKSNQNKYKIEQINMKNRRTQTNTQEVIAVINPALRNKTWWLQSFYFIIICDGVAKSSNDDDVAMST